MIAMPLIGVILPLGAMYYDGSVWVLAGIFFVGWGLTGIFPLFMATVPSESVDRRHIATVLGVCMGTGEIVGGVLRRRSQALPRIAADCRRPSGSCLGLRWQLACWPSPFGKRRPGS